MFAFPFVFREGNSSEDAEDFELISVGREDEYTRRFSLGIKKKISLDFCYISHVNN